MGSRCRSLCWSFALLALSLIGGALSAEPLRVVRELDPEGRGGAPFPPETGIGLGLEAEGRGWLGWAHGGRTLPDATNVSFGLDAAGAPRALAVDTRAGELLLLRARGRNVVAETLRLAELVGLDASGIALDVAGDRLFVLEPARGRIVLVEGVLTRARRRLAEIALPANPPPLRGLAFDPVTGHLHALAPASGELLELDTAGVLLAVRQLPVEARSGVAIAIAASTDRTDDPQQNRLFVAAPSAGGGITYELALEPAVFAAATTVPATLLQTILTSNFSPPSPDPSGIELLAANGPLLISDGEVEEMAIYQGVNLWEVNLSGSVAATANTLAFSDEPTGVAKNPGNGRLFFSDDGSGQYIYEVTPGSDGRVSPGDAVRSIRAANYGAQDAEGVAFGGGALWLADGAGSEVYKILPGGNGTFDGGGDDVVTHFDTGGSGLSDVEGIAYDSDGGNVYVSGTDSLIGHFSPTGTLLRWIDVGSANPSNSAGLAYGPGPAGSTTRRLYLVARGKDNNSDPNENDGKLFVFAVDPLGGGGGTNEPPLASAGSDLAVVLPASASLDGTVSDDGNPSGTLTTTWSQVSGPGTVTFANANAVDTTATFSAAGTYVVRLTASDGQLSTSDEAAITVTSSGGGGGNTADVRVAAAADDAEQAPSGSVDTGSSDLELVADGSAVQTVGLRFAGVAIPPGAAIQSAWIQFMADETSSDATSLLIQGEAADNAAPFTTGTNNVSARPRTSASIGWSPPPWSVVGETAAAQRTPDLTQVVQQIVSRGGWQSGNAMAFIVTGSGRRVAESFEGTAAGAALLHVEFGAAGGNLSPVVSAGPDRVIGLGQTAALDGTVSDDAQPNPTPTTTWSKVSGPGAVGFADASAVDTSASFTAAGTYVLRLSAWDGALTAQDDMSVVVFDPNASGVVDRRITVGADDVEQRVQNGSMSLTGGDLELGVDGTRAQLVGLRFSDLLIPPGATIQNAWIQFTADEVKIDPASLSIQGEKSANAAAFAAVGFNLSSRPRTTASVPWTPAGWTLVGAAGAAEQTPNLKDVVQEIVDQPGWSPGNAMLFVVSGTGTRTAEPVEGGATRAPVLHVEYGP